MKVSFYFCLSGMCFLVAFLLLMSGVRRQEEALAARIAPAVLRFHVLANSDSPEDQAIKLQVKDLLLKEIREGAGDAAQNKEELCRYISENRHELETAAENYMAECGVSHSSHCSPGNYLPWETFSTSDRSTSTGISRPRNILTFTVSF